MVIKFLSLALTGVMLLTNVGALYAFETDQYDLPPRPLSDIGPEVSEHVAESVASAIRRINDEIAMRESCLAGKAPKTFKCDAPERERQRLAILRSGDAVAESVYQTLGEGDLFTTAIDKWFSSQTFRGEPSRFKPSYSGSIFLTRPLNYATLSPTVKMYGSDFGFDKIDHFFQQGYKYYKKYNDAISEGKTAEQASQEAISWGRMTERTYFGSLVSGVYSNGDLFANYAGMKFYRGLTKEITVNRRVRPAILSLKDGKWEFNKAVDLDDGLLRPFIADQLNEALNPSGYSFFLYKVVKKVVRDRACKGWRELYPNATASEFQKRSEDLEKWNGEEYGFTRKSKSVPIAICFEDKLSAK